MPALKQVLNSNQDVISQTGQVYRPFFDLFGDADFFGESGNSATRFVEYLRGQASNLDGLQPNLLTKETQPKLDPEDCGSILPSTLSEESYERHPSFNLPIRPLVEEELELVKKLELGASDQKKFEAFYESCQKWATIVTKIFKDFNP